MQASPLPKYTHTYPTNIFEKNTLKVIPGPDSKVDQRIQQGIKSNEEL